MIACPSCGQENREGLRLCGMCGASLVPETAAREERKVVTVLFCDLAGFTAKADQLDPEEVRAVLRPYHDRVRSELEHQLACLDRDFVRAAEMWVEAGSPTWEARYQRRAAEELGETGRRAESEEQATRALAFFRSVNATYYVERCEALLREAKTA